MRKSFWQRVLSHFCSPVPNDFIVSPFNILFLISVKLFSRCHVHYLSPQLHIDGHSDFALPGYYNGLPVFRWPESEEDILRLMQKNDVFIIVRLSSS